MERDLQQLQIDARRELTQTVTGRPREAKKLTLIEARRQRCRHARCERYLAVVELHRQGHTQLAIAERIGIRPKTIARWLHAPEFPERRIRSDRRPDQALFVQKQERRL
jgi:DNA-binding NarL/FixJ family response regulator